MREATAVERTSSRLARAGAAAILVAACGCGAADSADMGAAGGVSDDASWGGPTGAGSDAGGAEELDLVGDALAADGEQPSGADDATGSDDALGSSDQRGGGTPDAAVGPGDLKGGVLIFELNTGSGDYDKGNAVAFFGPPDPGAAPVFAVGHCDVLLQGQEPPPTHPSADAGLIQITGTAIPIELEWSSADRAYHSSLPDSNTDVLSKYDSLIHVVSSGGADVPPFSGDLSTPAAVQISSPLLGLTSLLSTSEAMVVTWNADSPGKVARTLVTVSPVGFDLKPIKGEFVLCTVAADATTFTVPQEAMAALPSSFGTRLVVSVTRVVETHVSAGGVPVTLAATASFGGVASAK